MKQYKNEYGTVFAVREKDGAPRLMCKSRYGKDWAISGVLAACTGNAKTAEELQAVLDRAAEAKGWRELQEVSSKVGKAAGIQPEEVYRSPNGTLYKIAKTVMGKKCCYHTVMFDPRTCEWQNANSSMYDELTNAQGEFKAWIRTQNLTPTAPNGAAAATMAGRAAAPEAPAETSTTLGAGRMAPTLTPAKSPSASLPGQSCPADAAPAASSLSAAGAASLAAEPAPPAFDFDGLDKQTAEYLRLAEREYAQGKIWAERGLRRMADGVAIAHEALCGSSSQLATSPKRNNQYSDDTFRAWCTSIGISKDTAYRLLQVSTLFDQSSPKQQKVLEQLAPSLLYAAAKPSAPAELVQGVKDGGITTHKQYQALLKAHQETLAENQRLREGRTRAIQEADRSRTLADEAERRAKGLEGSYHTAHANEEAAVRRAAEAEQALDGARQVAQAARQRADKYKAENDALRAQLQAAPATVEAQVMDADEVARLADERARALLAQWQAEQPQAEDAAHEAYDAVILACRTLDAVWASLRPSLPRIAPGNKSVAINLWLQKLMSIKEEAIKCL